ncbi:similar to Saccharomyces cerevisiae YMR144W Putative protein of unknown function [Maudiozyma saulgeensis]|uniref:Uncharacterized protein n=1 Tax=Maudiozyma saulgeensis TaxID=1789683 RepID=A0A1X7QZE6_9SACH|nr:similar to Saccharomyces cerevisiae YMR144W Putative protein of unknown function [Kazachstania saulgeensis]
MNTNIPIGNDEITQKMSPLTPETIVQTNVLQAIEIGKKFLQREKDSDKTIGSNIPTIAHNPTDAETVVCSLVDALTNSSQHIQQLKFKNLMLSGTKSNIESRHEVEGNLQKHEYERIKTQMLHERQNMIQNLNTSNNKVQKYKKRIVEKNREINKLLKLLNDHSIDVTQIELSSIEPSSTSSIRVKSPDDISKNRKADMLKALGALATQVLNDDTEDGSINQTYIQSSMRAEDENITEAEISVYQPYNHANRNNETQQTTSSNVLLHKFSNGPILPEIKNNSQLTPVVLPKMRSFSTIDNNAKKL